MTDIEMISDSIKLTAILNTYGFADYFASSGADDELKEKYSGKSFADILKMKSEIEYDLLQPMMGSVILSITEENYLFPSQFIGYSLEDASLYANEPKELTAKVPGLIAIGKAYECIIPEAYHNDTVNYQIFPNMEDCLSSPFTTRFDAEIRAYYLSRLADIRNNNAEALKMLEESPNYQLVKGLLSELSPAATIDNAER